MNYTDSFQLTQSSSLLLHLIRGGAAQAVVIGHGLYYFRICDRFISLQTSAVVIFFILSGIVIPHSTFCRARKGRDYTFSSYFIDRFSRIYMGFVPALFFVLGVDILCKHLFGSAYIYGKSLNAPTFIENLLMLQGFPVNVFVERVPVSFMKQLSFDLFGSGRPMWTVAIEWWIYLLFGWLALGAAFRQKRPLLYLFILFLFLVIPSCNWILNGTGNGLTMMWAMGLIVYLILSRMSVKLSASDSCLLSGAFLLFALMRISVTHEAYDALYVGLLAISLYFALLCLQQREIAMPKTISSLIIFNANFSYTLYLVHFTVLNFLLLWLGPGAVNMLLGCLLSNIVSIAMYHAFERHYKAFARWLKQTLKIT